MNTYTYHKDIRTILAAVGNVFGGMTINRMIGDEESPTFDKITIPIYYSPKTRTLNELVNTSKHIKLPLLSYELKTIQYDSSRAFNKQNGYLIPRTIDDGNRDHPMPTPVKMIINSSFLCRFQEDYHQYITCLFTYFSPYVEISYKHPDLDNEVRCRLIWDGTANISTPEQFTGTEPYRFMIDAAFTVETWLYKNDEGKANIIYNIPITFTGIHTLSDNYDLMKAQQEIDVNTDARVKEGRPIVWYTATEVVNVGKAESEILIRGDMFDTVTGVAVVDMDPTEKMYDESQYKYYDLNYFAYNEYGEHDDKTHYVPFYGVPAEFEILDDHRLIVKIPQAKRSGRFDVYVMGKCGYGKLSEDSYRPYRIHQMENTKGIQGLILTGD